MGTIVLAQRESGSESVSPPPRWQTHAHSETVAVPQQVSIAPPTPPHERPTCRQRAALRTQSLHLAMTSGLSTLRPRAPWVPAALALQAQAGSTTSRPCCGYSSTVFRLTDLRPRPSLEAVGWKTSARFSFCSLRPSKGKETLHCPRFDDACL